MEKAISYTEYYKDIKYGSKSGNYSDITHDFRLSGDVCSFFKNSRDNKCPFCNNKLKIVFEGFLEEAYIIREKCTIWECTSCGWWEAFSEYSEVVNTYSGQVDTYNQDIYYYGIAKVFDLKSKELPLKVLMSEMNKKSSVLYDINPYKLEEFVQFVLSDFFDCEVKHVGKTGDGGIDLIVIQSDEPILVQVKRRVNPDHVELVKGVREFVGTLFIENARKGIYVTTSKRFSRTSKEVANQLLSDKKLDYFKLVDYDSFLSMLDLKKYVEKPWLEFTKDFDFDDSKDFGDRYSIFH